MTQSGIEHRSPGPLANTHLNDYIKHETVVMVYYIKNTNNNYQSKPYIYIYIYIYIMEYDNIYTFVDVYG